MMEEEAYCTSLTVFPQCSENRIRNILDLSFVPLEMLSILHGMIHIQGNQMHLLYSFGT